MPIVASYTTMECLELVRDAEPHLRRTPDETWLRRLDAIRDVFRDVFKSLNGIDAAEFAVGLWRWFFERGRYAEGVEFIRLAEVPFGDFPLSLRMESCIAIGALSLLRGKFKTAEIYLAYAWRFATLLKRSADRGLILHYQAVLYRRLNRLVESKAYHLRSLEIWRNESDLWGQATAHNALGVVSWTQGDLESAHNYFSLSAQFFIEVDDLRQSAKVINNLAMIAGERKLYEQAYKTYSRCIVLFRQLGDDASLASSLYNQAEICRESNCLRKANSLYLESFDLMIRTGYNKFIPYVIISLGIVAFKSKDYKRACTLFGAAETQCKDHYIELSEALMTPLVACQGELKSVISPQGKAMAYKQGRRMNLEEIAAVVHMPF